VADAAAQELCSKLEELARQVVGLQVLLAQKDAQLSALAAAKAALEERLSGGDGIAR
jgi:Tfp pilus assembly protein FimV